MTWTPELVFARFIEAADTEWRSPRERIGPRDAPAFWPEFQHTFADMVSWDSKRRKERSDEFWRTRNRPSAAAISRMEEALYWGLQGLTASQRKMLWCRCFCLIRGWHFNDWCEKNGVVRMTAYRWFNQALEAVTNNLNEECVPIRHPDMFRVLQIVKHKATRNLMLDIRSMGEAA